MRGRGTSTMRTFAVRSIDDDDDKEKEEEEEELWSKLWDDREAGMTARDK